MNVMLSTLAYQRPGWTPPNSVDAVISDVDGTLFGFAGCQQLSDRDCAALEAVVDAGKHVCIATGRIPGPWLDSICAQLHPRQLSGGVYANGALVFGGADGTRVVQTTTLPAEAVAAVLEQIPSGRAGSGRVALIATVFADGAVRYLEHAPAGSTFATALVQGAGEPIEPVADLGAALAGAAVLKFVVFSAFDRGAWPERVRPPEDDEAAHGPWSPMEPVVEALRAALAGTGADVLACGSNHCEVQPRSCGATAGRAQLQCVHRRAPCARAVQVLPPRVTKGAGVATLLEHLGVSPERALACGDAENDVEMLQLVGCGVAMGNAKPQAVAVCDVQTASQSESGVAQAVERLVLGQ